MFRSNLQFCLRFGLAILLIAIASQSTQAQTGANKCPSELLFSLGGYYYYGVVNCGNSQTETVIYVYDQTVETGCKTDGSCKNTVPLYGEINQPVGGVGDPPGKKIDKKFKPVTVGEQLMTPFGNSKISVIGTPSFVKASILEEDRYFKVFQIRYKTKTYSFGVEVNANPATVGKTVKQGTFDGYGKSVVKMTVSGSNQSIEAIYEK